MFHQLLALTVMLQFQAQPLGTADLLRQLVSQDKLERLSAAAALAKRDDKLPKEAIDAMVVLLDDKDAAVRGKAVQILRQSRSTSKLVIEGLVRILKIDYSTANSWEASVALVQIGRPAVPAMMTAIQSDENDWNWEVLSIFARLRSNAKDAIPLIEQRLAKVPVKDRLAVACIIADIDPENKSIRNVLTAGLKDPSNGKRLIAAEAIAKSSQFRTKEALDILIGHVTVDVVRDNSNLRAAAAIARYGSSGTSALNVLRDQFSKCKDNDLLFAVMIAGAIAKIKGKDEKCEDANEYLKSHRDILEEIAGPNSDRSLSEYAKDLLENVLKKQ